jgi:hypothetical protein
VYAVSWVHDMLSTHVVAAKRTAMTAQPEAELVREVWFAQWRLMRVLRAVKR